MVASFQDLLATPEPAGLGPTQRAGIKSLQVLDAAFTSLFQTTPLSLKRQELIRSLIYLWHDHHDAAHTLAQDLRSADGSYIHGLVHRREPDYSNAKYWFLRAGEHRVYQLLTEKTGQSWDPIDFIDRCEQATRSDIPELQRLQKLEFSVLLDLLSHE